MTRKAETNQQGTRELREGYRQGNEEMSERFYAVCTNCGKSFKAAGKTKQERMAAFTAHICRGDDGNQRS